MRTKTIKKIKNFIYKLKLFVHNHRQTTSVITVLVVFVLITLWPATTYAAPTAIIVQEDTDSGGSVTSLSVVYPSAPAEDSLLVAVLFTRGSTAPSAGTLPTGWSTAVEVEDTTNFDWLGVYYKVAGASEGVTHTFSGLTSDTSSIWGAEYTGLEISSVLDKTGSTARTVGTTISSGTTATTTQANELAIAGFSVRSDESSSSYSNGFTEEGNITTSIPVAETFAAYKDLTATGTVESTLTKGASSESMGVIATFKVAQTNWYNTSWSYRIKITIASTKVDENVVNFPVYIDMNDLGVSFFANVRTDGGDIRMTTANGATELAREVVAIDTGAPDSGELYFNANALSSTSDTIFYLYYGNASATEPAITATYGAENTWNSSYKSVWHLNEDPSLGSTNNILDSTSNNNDGGDLGSMTAADQVAAKLGGGLDFDGSNDYINLGTPRVVNGTAYTVSSWFKSSSTATGKRIYSEGNSTTVGHYFYFSLNENTAGDLEFGMRDGTTFTGIASGASSYNNGAWRYAVAVQNSKSSRELFVDNVSKGTNTSTAGTVTVDRSYIGALSNGGGPFGYFAGVIDEVRISDSARSTGWIGTEYNNLNTPATFYTIGAQENDQTVSSFPKITQEGYIFENDDGAGSSNGGGGGVSSDWYDSNWTYRKKITVDNTKVAGTETDFPIYIDLGDLSSDFFDNVKSDGGDIRITKSDGLTELARELVAIDTGTADSGELYFKTGSLSGSADTDFYIYYGNSSAADYAVTATYGAQNVWTNGYVSVWHLNKDCADASSGCITDSVGNNDLTAQGFATGGNNDVAGKLGRADDFDGIDSYLKGVNNATQQVVDDYTVTAWANPDTDKQQGIFGSRNQTDLLLRVRSNGNLEGIAYRANDSVWTDYNVRASANPLTNADGWQYVGFTVSSTTGKLYHNGLEVSSYSATTIVGTPNASSASARGIGYFRDFGTPADVFDGQIDEVRFNDNTLSANWLSTEYNNQNSASTFYSVGAQEVDSGSSALVTFASYDEASVSASTTITVNKPTGTVEGDLLLTVWATDYDATEPTFTTLSGWTLVNSYYESTGGTKIAAYYKVAGASEPTSYTWTQSVASNQHAISVFRILGTDTSSPIDVSSFTGDTTSDGNYVAPSITPTIENGVLISAVASPDVASITVPASMTLLNDHNESADAHNNSVAFEQLASSAATGTKTFTSATSTTNSVFSLVLVPEDTSGSVLAGSEFVSGKTLSGIRQGERTNLRIQLTNSGGAVATDDEFGLFYDRNDDIWTRVKESTIYENSTGNCDTDTDFNCSVVAATDDVGSYARVAINPITNLPWVSYYDVTNTSLMVANYVGSGGIGCAGGSSAWSCTTVDATDIVGDYNSIGFDSSGTAWVSYRDDTNDNLEVAKYVGSGGNCDTVGAGSDAWECTTVDVTDLVGRYTSIAFDSSDNPWVSYRAYGFENDLLVARYVGSGGTGCAGGSSAWTCTTIDATDNVGYDTSIAFDPSGNAWISYYDATNGNLQIAKYVGSGGNCDTVGAGSDAWECTTVDVTDDIGESTSIAFDPSGSPWISYVDFTNGNLEVAKYVGSGGNCDTVGAGSDAWECTTVDATDSVGFDTSIDFDPSGNPWVSYLDNTNTSIEYARYVGSGGNCDTVGAGSDAWECSRIDNSSAFSGQTSIAFDDDGQAWLVFYDGTAGDLELARFNTRSGEISIAGSLNSTNNDILNVSHADMTSVTDTTGQTDIDCLASGANWNNGRYFESGTGSGLSLSNGDVTEQCTEIAWTIDTSQAVPGTTYRFVVALKDANPDSGGWLGPIAVATDAYPTLTISEADGSIYRYSKGVSQIFTDCEDADWTCDQIADGTNDGLWPSIAYTQDGVPWISYQDDSGANGNLMVAKYVGSGNGTGCFSSAWDCETIESTDDKGTYTSIGFDSAGIAWISYKSTTGNDLKIARYVGSGAGTGCDSADWTCESLITGGNVGDWSELVFDNNANPWVFYRDVTGGDLEYAKYVGSGNGTGCASTSWSCETIQTTNDTGIDLSVQFSADGVPWVAFRDATANDLLVANYVGVGGDCTNPAWECESVDTTGSVAAEGVSIGFNSSNTPVVVYHYLDQNDLRYAEYVGSGGDCDTLYAGSDAWTCTTIDTANSTGLEQSLAIDSQGDPWVSYKDSTNGDLKYARYVGSGGAGCSTAAWDACSIISSYNVNQSQIGFDDNATPWIVMYDTTGTGLFVAKLKNPPNQLSNRVVTPRSQENAGNGDLQYILTSGLSPSTDLYGTCGGLATLLGYCGLYTADGQTDSLSAGAKERPIYAMSTRYDNNNELPTAKLSFTTSVSPATQNVVLQAYRYGTTNAWEDVATYSTAGCSSENCVVRGVPSGTASEYYETDGSEYWVHYRVYQVEGAGTTTLTVDSFTAFQTQKPLRGGRVWRENKADPLRW